MNGGPPIPDIVRELQPVDGAGHFNISEHQVNGDLGKAGARGSSVWPPRGAVGVGGCPGPFKANVQIPRGRPVS